MLVADEGDYEFAGEEEEQQSIGGGVGLAEGGAEEEGHEGSKLMSRHTFTSDRSRVVLS